MAKPAPAEGGLAPRSGSPRKRASALRRRPALIARPDGHHLQRVHRQRLGPIRLLEPRKRAGTAARGVLERLHHLFRRSLDLEQVARGEQNLGCGHPEPSRLALVGGGYVCAVMTVAFLGAGGTMGLAMARNLAGAGIDVRAWNRTREKAEPLADDGVAVADTPGEAAGGADVVLTMLSDADAVIAVMD